MSKRRITDDDIQKAQDEYDMWLAAGMADSDDGEDPEVIRADEDFFIDALENLDDLEKQKAEQDAEDARIEAERQHEEARRREEELYAAAKRFVHGRVAGGGRTSAPHADAAAPAPAAQELRAGQSGGTDHAPAHAAKLPPLAIAFIIALWAVAILVFSFSLAPQSNESASSASTSSSSSQSAQRWRREQWSP